MHIVGGRSVLTSTALTTFLNALCAAAHEIGADPQSKLDGLP
jgi:hypothetical protein